MVAGGSLAAGLRGDVGTMPDAPSGPRHAHEPRHISALATLRLRVSRNAGPTGMPRHRVESSPTVRVAGAVPPSPGGAARRTNPDRSIPWHRRNEVSHAKDTRRARSRAR